MSTIRSSFSQHNMFSLCKKCWLWAYVLKIPQCVQDMCYANAGTVIHKCMDKYYTEKCDVQTIKDHFNMMWDKFYLSSSSIKHKKDEYWVMCLNGMQLNLPLTSVELKIFYPEVVAYLDGVDTVNDKIIDWKTSTRSEENEHEYRLQLRLYAWLYFKKFGRIPKECSIIYMKYSGTKSVMSFNFTEQDIQEAEKWFYDILNEMQYYTDNPDKIPPFNTNYFFSPYKNMWGCEDSEKIKFVLHVHGNHLQLEGAITPLLEKGIIKKFSYELKDAYFIKKRLEKFLNKMGKDEKEKYLLSKTTVKFWNSKNKALPIGFRDSLLKTLQDYAEYKKLQLDLNITDHRTFDNTIVEMPEQFVNGRVLRDYQVEAVDKFLRNKVGILELATGSGKTECSIEVIRRLRMRTLFIVDKVELMKQTMKRIQDCLGYFPGQIGQGIEDIKDITVATIQTLNKNPLKYQNYLSTVRFVIFDETHKVASNSYVKISKYLVNTEYRLGLSGTAWRDDGNDMMLTAVTGNIIHAVNSKFLIDKGYLIKPKIMFIKNYIPKHELTLLEQQCKDEIRNLENSKRKGLINETVEISDREKYGIYYNKFIYNLPHRNNKIIETVNKHRDKKVLILTKLVDHGVQLQNNLKDSKHLHGETPKQEREQIMKDFKEGNLNILISTVSIWSEGLDMPSLQVIINVSANKGDIKSIQMLGRVLRQLEGKSNATYIDFWDEPQFLIKASMSRRKAFLKQGHDVEITEI